jgi:hypothetical protein
MKTRSENITVNNTDYHVEFEFTPAQKQTFYDPGFEAEACIISCEPEYEDKCVGEEIYSAIMKLMQEESKLEREYIACSNKDLFVDYVV